MSKGKQIEEMAFILDGCCNNLPDAWCETYDCSTCKAKQIYDAGYRKQSEGEWLHGAYDEDNIYTYEHICSCCEKSCWTDRYEHRYPFCPNCGARMKEGAE